MSLITRCPACETMFKVVPDQLRISEGWARCGQCGEVFDAAQQLITDPALVSDAIPGNTTSPTPDSGSAFVQSPSTPAAVPDPAIAIAVTAMARQPMPQAVAPPKPASHSPVSNSDPAPPTAAGEPLWVQPSAADPLPARAVPAASVHAQPADTSSGFQPTRTEEDPHDVSFMRDGKKPSAWRKPAVRAILLLLLVLLVALLAVQFLRHERDRIVSVEPSARPLLAALCDWSRCALGPLRQIESIVIDSSSFTRVRGENYRLAFSLRNKAALDLAMPALELALTDAQDQPVVRRVIPPAEFGAATDRLAAGSDWSSSLSLSVKATTSGDRIAGYRLLAFYP